jgi:hypothetical protein
MQNSLNNIITSCFMYIMSVVLGVIKQLSTELYQNDATVYSLKSGDVHNSSDIM